MNPTQQIARHLRDTFFGGNWTALNFKDTLADVNWQQATTKLGSLNTIAALVYHVGYFVKAIRNVLEGNPLDAHDKFSFDCPPIQSQADWERLQAGVWSDVEALARLIEQLPEEKLSEDFWDSKYGSYYRNFHGLIEHSHYHLGQIVIIKKLLAH